MGNSVNCIYIYYVDNLNLIKSDILNVNDEYDSIMNAKELLNNQNLKK